MTTIRTELRHALRRNSRHRRRGNSLSSRMLAADLARARAALRHGEQRAMQRSLDALLASGVA